MPDDALTGLAESSAAAVVGAVGTDGWSALREGLVVWFGRGSRSREQAALQQLNGTVVVIQLAGTDEERRREEETRWRTRFRNHLEDLNDAECERAAADLAKILAVAATVGRTVRAGDGGLAVGGDMSVRASGKGAVAAAVVGGDVSVTHPRLPDASQG